MRKIPVRFPCTKGNPPVETSEGEGGAARHEMHPLHVSDPLRVHAPGGLREVLRWAYPLAGPRPETHRGARIAGSGADRGSACEEQSVAVVRRCLIRPTPCGAVLLPLRLPQESGARGKEPHPGERVHFPSTSPTARATRSSRATRSFRVCRSSRVWSSRVCPQPSQPLLQPAPSRSSAGGQASW